MKKHFISFCAVLFFVSAIAYAQTSGGITVPQGGTGLVSIPQYGWLSGGGTGALRLVASSSPTVGYITATSSTASTFVNLTVSGTCTGCGDGGGGASFGQAFEITTNTFGQAALKATSTKTHNLVVDATGTSTFAGGIEVWGNIGAPYFNATSSTATSSLQATSITGAISLLGEYFTNFTTYVRSLFSQGTGISISGGQITNTGVTSILAGTNITVSGATGDVTVNAVSSGTVATSSSETSGYVPYWSSTSATPATLGSDSGLQYSATADRLTATYASTTAITSSGTSDFGGLVVTGNITNSALTSGRVPYASTGGLLVDNSNLTYDGTTFSVGANVALSGTGTSTVSNLSVNSLQVGVTGFSYVNFLAPYFTATTTTASVFPNANITQLSNLSSNGLIYTAGGIGTLNTTATTSLTASSPLSLSQPISVIGSSASALSLDTSGTWAGLAGTATALASDPTDCGSNTWATTIAASGNLTCSAVTYAGITAMTSANFFGLISDETGGSGVVVGSASPTLTGLTTMTYASTTMLTTSAGATFATASGNVGIGTTSPSKTLSVQGNAIVSGTITASNFRNSSSTSLGGVSLDNVATSTIRLFNNYHKAVTVERVDYGIFCPSGNCTNYGVVFNIRHATDMGTASTSAATLTTNTFKGTSTTTAQSLTSGFSDVTLAAGESVWIEVTGASTTAGVWAKLYGNTD